MNFKIVSSNIRFDNPEDGKHIWANRRPILSKIINDFNPAIIGTQEGREPQLKNLEDGLTNLKMATIHRDWIPERMYPCLFVNLAEVDLLESGDFWLSNTPNVPASKSFGSAFPRLCTWIKINHQASSEVCYIFNCHLDHLNTNTRLKQAEVLISEILKINSSNQNMILMGDFNEGPFGKVRTILNKKLSNLCDPWIELGKKEEGTHHQFTGVNDHTVRIDWILTTKNFSYVNIETEKYHEENIWPSDHFPIKAHLRINS